MNALLELDGVDVIFRRGSRTFQALHEVNLALFAGERVGLVGGSGSGKTTFLRCLNLLERPGKSHHTECLAGVDPARGRGGAFRRPQG